MREKKSQTAPLLLRLDASEIIGQISELIALFESERPFIKGTPEDVVNLFLDHINTLTDDVILCNHAPAGGATDTSEICLKVKIVRSADKLASAIRAGNIHELTF